MQMYQFLLMLAALWATLCVAAADKMQHHVDSLAILSADQKTQEIQIIGVLIGNEKDIQKLCQEQKVIIFSTNNAPLPETHRYFVSYEFHGKDNRSRGIRWVDSKKRKLELQAELTDIGLTNKQIEVLWQFLQAAIEKSYVDRVSPK